MYNFGFLDFEMTCDGIQENGKFIDDNSMKRSEREIISVGLVICNEKYNIKRKYSTFIKPLHNTVLTDYCKNLTGITQNDVDHGKKCNNAFRDILEICKEYSVRYLFTFGNEDEKSISYSARWNRKAKEKIYNLHNVAIKIIDIRPSILNEISNKKIKTKGTGLSKIAANLNIEINGACHNSLNDAILLFEVCRKLDINLKKKNKVKIRLMKISDYEQVYELLFSCKEVALNELYDSEEYIARFLKKNPNTCFVAEEYEKVVGVIIAGNDGRKGYIHHIAIDYNYKRQGIATKLVNNVINSLKSLGINKTDLVVFSKNSTGNAFWEKLGFVSRKDLTYRNK